MSLHSPPNSNPKQLSKVTIDTKKTCEQCRRRRRVCDAKAPCSQCLDANQNCVYSVVSDHSRSVFSTQAARRLSSGSACETCRRRKTKCDGGSPCFFCANNNIECVNHSERRHSAKQNHHHHHNNTTSTNKPPAEAIERIEDRLRRIERLMTAFSPSPLSNTTNAPDSHKVRPHRYSVQGINVAKEQAELNIQYDIKRRGSPYSSPRFSSLSPPPQSTINSNGAKRPLSNSVAHSMLNLSLSSSTSSTSSSYVTTNNQQEPFPFMSTSSPSPSGVWPMTDKKTKEFDQFLMDQQQQQNTNLLPSPPNSARSTSSIKNQENTSGTNKEEWKTSGSIPSMMDQLSKITFATTANNYNFTTYPIYPLTPPPNHSRQITPPPTRPNSHS